ncbi:hypothetical protein DPSP01_000286 [Paraphaeosphaeria sporulosa]|uniref:SH3 domain-containing protein n=1 Tax=Paraphaeosphaeria sporulosa TaxID=1460663 RepID=A0A177D169_9PLEO|nr:uncharacterized protein CC84DRAFT_158674 [Paraphaeosphaeria sporulosa]OAG12779.1 hypothetical protein CC84DRAFT_158674 [Paraphaeosphaeria sporulosa]
MDICAPSDDRCNRAQRPRPASTHQHQPRVSRTSLAVALLAATLPAATAQSCVSLQGSTECPAFSNASISNSIGDFPFLSFVSDVESFDSRLRDYIGTAYVQDKYVEILGCSNVSLTNTTNLYARYTTSFLCNAIVQASLSNCNEDSNSVATLCADSCAQFAISEQDIISTPAFCGTPGTNANDQIRSDSDRCQHAAKALSGKCTPAVENEPDECGFSSNLPGLCAFCASSSQNSTDSCCVNANVESRCVGVQLPTTTTMPPLFTTTSTAAPTGSSSAAAAGASGLSGGAIAGIVIGSIVGAAALLGLIIAGCIFARKRKQHQQNSVLNTPSPTRHVAVGPPMTYGGDGHSPPPTIVPGARVARMSALEGSSSSNGYSSPRTGPYHERLDPYDSPESHRAYIGANLPKREGSLSSHSALGMVSGHTSPRSVSDPDRNFSSPEGVASGQSEQLQFFKDYYSHDDIHPNDTVAVLWAYQPRANDEFELERGDMLKVVGIWDDGWATGVRLTETADEWEARRALQRDSGVSNGSRQSRIESDSEIKAFPLVCVCLPQHWRKTIEGDSTDTGGGSGGDRHPPSP